METFYKLKLSIPDKQMSGNQVRHLISRENERLTEPEKLPPEFFHYDEDGHPKSGISPFRFGGGRTPSVLAVGNEAALLLKTKGYIISDLLSHFFDTSIEETRTHGPIGVSVGRDLHTYAVYGLIFAAKPGLVDRFTPDVESQTPSEELIKRVEFLLKESIRRQAVMFGVDLESDENSHVLGDVKIGKDSFFKVPHKNRIMYGIKELTFSTSLVLAGPWSVGNKISLGFGRVRTVKVHNV